MEKTIKLKDIIPMITSSEVLVSANKEFIYEGDVVDIDKTQDYPIFRDYEVLGLGADDFDKVIVYIEDTERKPKLRDICKEFQNAMKETRFEKGLTLHDLAVKTGINDSLLSRYENGVISPTFDQIAKICEGLGVSASQLFDNGTKCDD